MQAQSKLINFCSSISLTSRVSQEDSAGNRSQIESLDMGVWVWLWLWGLHTLAERNNRKFSNARKHLLFVQLVEFMRVKQRLTIAA